MRHISHFECILLKVAQNETQLPTKEHPSQSETCWNFDLTDEEFEVYTHGFVLENTFSDTPEP